MYIFLCNGGTFEASVLSKLAMMSSRQYAQSRPQNSLDFSLDLKIDDSRFDMSIEDIPDMGSAFTLRSNAFN